MIIVIKLGHLWRLACLRGRGQGRLLGSEQMKGYLVDDYFEELGFCDNFTFEIAAIDDKYDSIGPGIIS